MALWLAAALAHIAPAEETAKPVYLVERVGTIIADDEKIGVRRMGAFCLPTGALHWKDIVPSRTMDQREVVEDALEDAGLPLADTVAPGRAARLRRIKGSVTTADFRVCAKLGAFRDAAVVGDVALDVEWRVQGPAEGEAVRWTSHVTRHLTAKTTLGTAYRDLLTDAARDLAEKLKARPQD